jgi:epoxyqueuosine reductase
MIQAKIQKIRHQADKLGFDAVGFTDDFSPKHKNYYLNWIRDEKYGDMKWLAKNVDKRLNPATIQEDTCSVIVLATSYNCNIDSDREFKIARYAQGEDYHHWIKNKLEKLGRYIQETVDPSYKWRSFVDTGPLLERDLAAKSGIGWVGKNTCLINPELGSFVFLSAILGNINLKQTAVSKDQCGSCRLCIDACPTQALSPYQLNASRCLAYHNIEKRGERDALYWDKWQDWLVGCDICQEVCPWNHQVEPSRAEEWLDSFSSYQINSFEELLTITNTQFRKKFKSSALSRIKYIDFMRNAFIVIANLGRKDLLPLVKAWKERNPEPEIIEWKRCTQKLSEN